MLMLRSFAVTYIVYLLLIFLLARPTTLNGVINGIIVMGTCAAFTTGFESVIVGPGLWRRIAAFFIMLAGLIATAIITRHSNVPRPIAILTSVPSLKPTDPPAPKAAAQFCSRFDHSPAVPSGWPKKPGIRRAWRA